MKKNDWSCAFRFACVPLSPLFMPMTMSSLMVESGVIASPMTMRTSSPRLVVGVASLDCFQVVEVGGRPSPATPTDERGVGITRGCYDLMTSEWMIEAKMEKGQQALDSLQAQLADGDLYTQSAGDELAELLKQEGQLKRELADIESEWLAQQEALDALEADALPL